MKSLFFKQFLYEWFWMLFYQTSLFSYVPDIALIMAISFKLVTISDIVVRTEYPYSVPSCQCIKAGLDVKARCTPEKLTILTKHSKTFFFNHVVKNIVNYQLQKLYLKWTIIKGSNYAFATWCHSALKYL